MRPNGICTIFATAALGLALMAGTATAQSKKINKNQLVGTWALVSVDNTKADGSKVDVFGPSPKGILIFDRNGNYSLTIMRSDIPKFAASTSDQGTAQENKAVLAGLITHFGTYSLNEADKTLTTHIVASSFPNLAGAEQKRTISSLSKDELTYANPATATGTSAMASWKRAK
jgi:hypothetical protein